MYEIEYLENLFFNIELLAQKYIICISQDNDEYEKEQMLLLYKYEAIEIFNNQEKIEQKKLEKNKKFIAIQYIKYIFNFNPLEWLCFCIGIMSKYSQNYKNIFKKIVSDINENTKNNILEIIAIRLHFFIFNLSKLTKYHEILEKLTSKMRPFCFDNNGQINTRIFDFVISNANSNFKISNTDIIFPKNEKKLVKNHIIQNILNILNSSKQVICFFIIGEEGLEKSSLVTTVAEEQDYCIILVNLTKILKNNQEFSKFLTNIIREAFLNSAIICFVHSEILNNEKYEEHRELIFKNIEAFPRSVFFCSTDKIKSNFNKKIIIEINLDKPDINHIISAWDYVLTATELTKIITADELSGLFNFTPKKIKMLIPRLKGLKLLNSRIITKHDIIKCVKSHIIIEINNATKIKNKFSWKDLIIKQEEKNLLLAACSQIKHKSTVFGKWGIDQKTIYGKGLSMLFSGPSGTGKTMAASVVAHELGLDLFKVDFSRIISKYIGETEKNLSKIFDDAKKSNIILLFDETDAIFSKRSEIKDSHDRNANIEVSYLLQKMEEYDGICVLTTNFLGNIDKAFFRRITYVVHFDLPDYDQRLKIWENIYGKKVPLEPNIDFKFLSKFEISGGNIKNAAIASAFLAASDIKIHKKQISMRHILVAIKQELKKQGHILLNEDFSEYAYLLNNN
ncbi:MAG: AAA family ATPase [Candidatus Improbicoccus devescovinae]|nr:MAG: AAA family ATPase [Candidatus Improbicoccus devescovinae]